MRSRPKCRRRPRLHPAPPTEPAPALDVAARWRQRHEAACAFGSDRDAVAVVHAESGAILEALGVADRGSAPDDLSDFSHRELIGLVATRSRQMAGLGMTPGAAAAYVPSLAEALGGGGLASRFGGLLAVSMEAYVIARDEHQIAAGQQLLAEHTPVIRLGDGLVACFLLANPESERVTRVVERLEREAFRANARAILVDVGHLRLEPESLAAALGADEGAKMLGIRCIFTGVDDKVRQALAAAGISLDQLEVAATFEEGLERLGRRGWMGRLLGR